MSWVWPESVVQEVAERRATFVLGAGVSMSSVDASGSRPPSWIELLNFLKNDINENNRKRLVSSTINKGRLLEAAEVIEDSLPPNEISRILRKHLKTPGYEPSGIHKIILDIDPKIIITTNYDDILDRLVMQGPLQGGYVICRHTETHAVDDLRSGQRCIFKMHGCISDPANIILSKTSYFRARRDFPSFYNVLDAIFLTNTLIFLGSSMEDPDLQLILENVNISAPSNYHHFAIMERHRDNVYSKILRENYNVESIDYTKGKHEQVEEILTSLNDKVRDWRLTH